MRSLRTAASLLTMSVLFCSGCSSIRGFALRKPNPVRKPQQSEIKQFAAYWNANADRVDSILCDSVDVSGRAEGKPIPLTAKLGYRKPDGFRLTGTSIGGKSEVDLGSNPDEIWFWIARAKPPAVYFCKRDDLKDVNIAMAFHPDWIVDVMGVSSIDVAKFVPGQHTDPNWFTLVAREQTPTGHDVIRRILVDRQTMRIRKIELFDPRRKDQAMVQATLSEYYSDPQSGAFVPTKVRMLWPEADTKLTIKMPERKLRINAIDDQFAAHLFQRRDGDYLNTRVVDLAQLGGNRAVPVSANRPAPQVDGYDPRLRRAQAARLSGTIATQ